MTYTSTRPEGDAIDRALEQERLAISKAHPGYSEQQLEDIWQQHRIGIVERILDHRSTPRSLRANSQASRTAPRGLAVDIPGVRETIQASTSLTAAPMSRSKGSNNAYIGSQLDHGVTNAGKRTRQESDFGFSASYTYGSTADWSPTGELTMQQPYERELNPLDYIRQRSCSSNDSQLTAKRQRVVGLHPSTLEPYAHNVSPSTSMASSLSPMQFTIPSEPMSRQSSVTSASLRDDLSMMRINSSFSVGSEPPLFPFDESQENDALLCNSDLSGTATEVPSSSDPITRHTAHGVMSNGGQLSVGTQQISFSDCFPSQGAMPVALHADGNVEQKPAVYSHYTAVDMVRAASEQSNSSSDNSSSSSASSTDTKAVQRLQRQIQNGHRQQIMQKTSLTGPVSIDYRKDAKPRPLRPEEPGTTRKEPITKQQSYTRPSHPKQYCDLCNEYPNGFRGDHELKRHKDRSHTERRKVWICVDPHVTASASGDWKPQRPLGICKQCKQRKTYNVYYNAAAHLRRAHFFPRKRGRKARGEKAEKRAGKAGGEVPPIAWLKDHGYLKEIEIGPEDETSLDGDDEDYDESDGVPVATDLGFTDDQDLLVNAAGFPQYDFPMEFGGYMGAELNLGMQWAPTAPAMQHTLSAPAAMMMPVNDYVDFYSADGFDFAVDAAFGQAAALMR